MQAYSMRGRAPAGRDDKFDDLDDLARAPVLVATQFLVEPASVVSKCNHFRPRPDRGGPRSTGRQPLKLETINPFRQF